MNDDQYEPTFDQEEVHDLYEIGSRPVNQDILAVLNRSDRTRLEELYDSLSEDGYRESELHMSLLELGEYQLVNTAPVVEDDGAVERYLESTTLGEATVLAEDEEMYVEMIEEIDRSTQ